MVFRYVFCFVLEENAVKFLKGCLQQKWFLQESLGPPGQTEFQVCSYLALSIEPPSIEELGQKYSSPFREIWWWGWKCCFIKFCKGWTPPPPPQKTPNTPNRLFCCKRILNNQSTLCRTSKKTTKKLKTGLQQSGNQFNCGHGEHQDLHRN